MAVHVRAKAPHTRTQSPLDFVRSQNLERNLHIISDGVVPSLSKGCRVWLQKRARPLHNYEKMFLQGIMRTQTKDGEQLNVTSAGILAGDAFNAFTMQIALLASMASGCI